MKTALSFLALLIIMAVSARLSAQTTGIPLGKVPPVARKNFAELHPDQKVMWKHGEKNRFEACFFVDGIRNIDVFASDGSLLQLKHRILKSQTPAAIVKAVETAYPAAEWVEVYEVQVAGGGSRFYEVTFVAGGNEYEMNYKAEGRFLSGGHRVAEKTVAEN